MFEALASYNFWVACPVSLACGVYLLLGSSTSHLRQTSFEEYQRSLRSGLFPEEVSESQPRTSTNSDNVGLQWLDPNPPSIELRPSAARQRPPAGHQS